jgi:hypothetical protein
MAVTINFYNKYIEYSMEGGMDVDGDTWDVILMNSTHAYTATHDRKTDISANEIATGFGYTQGAKTLASVTWTESAGTSTFDAADVTWTASGGSIGPADDTVIYSETSTVPAADLLMCSIDHGGSQTAGDGTDFKITFNASGIYTIA